MKQKPEIFKTKISQIAGVDDTFKKDLEPKMKEFTKEIETVSERMNKIDRTIRDWYAFTGTWSENPEEKKIIEEQLEDVVIVDQEGGKEEKPLSDLTLDDIELLRNEKEKLEAQEKRLKEREEILWSDKQRIINSKGN